MAVKLVMVISFIYLILFELETLFFGVFSALNLEKKRREFPGGDERVLIMLD